MPLSRSCNKSAGVLKTRSEVDLGIARLWVFNRTFIVHYSPTSTTSYILKDESVCILDLWKYSFERSNLDAH